MKTTGKEAMAVARDARPVIRLYFSLLLLLQFANISCLAPAGAPAHWPHVRPSLVDALLPRDPPTGAPGPHNPHPVGAPVPDGPGAGAPGPHGPPGTPRPPSPPPPRGLEPPPPQPPSLTPPRGLEPPPPQPPSSQRSSKGLSGGQKAGIAIGVILGAGIVGLGGFVYIKRRQNIQRAQFGNPARGRQL